MMSKFHDGVQGNVKQVQSSCQHYSSSQDSCLQGADIACLCQQQGASDNDEGGGSHSAAVLSFANGCAVDSWLKDLCRGWDEQTMLI